MTIEKHKKVEDTPGKVKITFTVNGEPRESFISIKKLEQLMQKNTQPTPTPVEPSLPKQGKRLLDFLEPSLENVAEELQLKLGLTDDQYLITSETGYIPYDAVEDGAKTVLVLRGEKYISISEISQVLAQFGDRIGSTNSKYIIWIKSPTLPPTPPPVSTPIQILRTPPSTSPSKAAQAALLRVSAIPSRYITSVELMGQDKVLLTTIYHDALRKAISGLLPSTTRHWTGSHWWVRISALPKLRNRLITAGLTAEATKIEALGVTIDELKQAGSL